MVKSLELAFDLNISKLDSREIMSYKSGLETGLNIAESMIEQGLKKIPTEAFFFIGKHRERSLSWGDLIIGIQKGSGTTMKPNIFVDTDKYLCTVLHIHHMQGILDAFPAVFSVYDEVYTQTNDWPEARRITAKYMCRIRKYLEEAQR